MNCIKPREPYLSLGQSTHKVPLKLFEENRNRICHRLNSSHEVPKNSWVLLQGGDNLSIYDTDIDYVFRQESYFMWTFGVLEPGFYGLIEVKSGRSILFAPRFPAEYAIWMGPLESLDKYKEKYCVNEVYYVDEINDYLSRVCPDMLLLLCGINSDSGLEAKTATFKGIEKWAVDKTILYPVMADLRAIKTKLELDVLRYVCAISSAAHRKVMRSIKPGMSEYQSESIFLDYCYRFGGCRHVSYPCICGTGHNSLILHYGHAARPNNKEIRHDDMCLFDMGGNYIGYAADITCSFPCNGKFTPDQKLIYEAVYEANMAVQKATKPGVSWPDMHRLSEKIILTHLKRGGLVIGDVEEMLSAGLAAVFMPHGLGHLLGLDIHDAGGYLTNYPPRPTEPGISRLRTARVLEEGMVLTIEPGCYFNPILLEEAMNNERQKKFLVLEALERFKGFGGIRIEDDVVITKDGIEDLTKVPRTIEEIERWMAGLDDDKYN